MENYWNVDIPTLIQICDEVIKMKDMIYRQDAINAPIKMVSEGLEWVPVYHLKELPSTEREHGEWLERNVMQDRKDAKIPEWQSAKCSVCGKYHTTPYMYYFTNYDYCPNCGCAMARGDEDER